MQPMNTVEIHQQFCAPIETSQPALFDIFKWAAGVSDCMHDFADIDESLIFEGLLSHRLVSRFLYRFLNERPHWLTELNRGSPRWCSRSLLDGLIRHRASLYAAMKDQVDALQDLTSQMGDQSAPLIVFKGFSGFALTGDARLFRVGNDIDILHPDCALVSDRLRAMGFDVSVMQESHQNMIAREYAKATRGTVRIEVHKYLQIESCLEWALTSDLRPSSNPGRWVQPAFTRSDFGSRICYDYIARHCEKGKARGTEKLLFPNITMAVLILCAHSFQHCIQPNCWRIQLGELADIMHLARLDTFDEANFRSLLAEYNAWGPIGSVASLIHYYFMHELLSDDSLTRYQCYNADPGIPVKLTYEGGCATAFTADELIVPLSDRPITKRLQPNDFLLSPDDMPLVYSTPGHATDQIPVYHVLDRHISGSRTEEHIDVRLFGWLLADGLHLSIETSVSLLDGESILVQVLPDPVDAIRYSVLIFDPHGEIVATTSPKNTVCLANSGYLIELFLELESAERAFQYPLLVLLSLAHQDISYEPIKTIILPLAIRIECPMP